MNGRFLPLVDILGLIFWVLFQPLLMDGIKGTSLELTLTKPAGGLHAFDRGHILFSTKELYFEVLGQCLGHYWTGNLSWIIVT